MRTRGRALAALALLVALPAPVLAAGQVRPPPADPPAAVGCPSSDWSTYGRDTAHTFSVPAACSAISPATVPRLAPRWFLHTADSVTASPAVVGDTAYVGSWDGTFYAVDTASGAVRWTFAITAESPTAFGRIVSSATVLTVPDAATRRPRLVVLFGGGSTLWALDAATGVLLASLDLDPRDPALRATQLASDSPPVVEIESSPTVATVGRGRGQQLIFLGLDVHNETGVGRTGVVASRLISARDGSWSLQPVWKSDAETGATYTGPGLLTAGSGTGDGCGDVWSSAAVDVATDTLVYGSGNCGNPAAARAHGFTPGETLFAVRASTGQLLWQWRPVDDPADPASAQPDTDRDEDFGASPNIFRTADGRAVVGQGGKSARYTVRDLATGGPVWSALVGQAGFVNKGFAVGGFLGTPAVQLAEDGAASRVIGATAVPVPHSADDLDRTTWAVRALSAGTGAVAWVYRLAAPSYAATSVVNGVAFVPDTAASSLLALDAATGTPLWAAPLVGPPSSTAVVTGGAVFVGTGTRETDLEYKSAGSQLQDGTGPLGASPLSPVSGLAAFSHVP